MKFKKAKYVNELRNIKKAYDKLDYCMFEFDSMVQDYTEEKDYDLELPLLINITGARYYVEYFLKTILCKDFNLDEKEYKQICFDIIQTLYNYEFDEYAYIERQYNSIFYYDKEESDITYEFFKEDIESELAGATGEEWNIIIYTTNLFKISNYKIETDTVNEMLNCINDLFCALGKYLACKLDDQVFVYAYQYLMKIIYIRVQQYAKHIVDTITNTYKYQGTDAMLEHIVKRLYIAAGFEFENNED